MTKQQLLKKLKELKDKAHSEYLQYGEKGDGFGFDKYDFSDVNHIGYLRGVEDGVKSIIKLLEKNCPYDEPFHNHHDGCPSCDNKE